MSSVFNIAAQATVIASGEIPQYSRVVEYADSGVLKVRVADDDEAADAVTVTPVQDGRVAIKLLSGADTNLGIASAAVTVGAKLYAAADGELAVTGTLVEGYAREAAGEGEIVEWRYKPEPATGGGGGT